MQRKGRRRTQEAHAATGSAQAAVPVAAAGKTKSPEQTTTRLLRQPSVEVPTTWTIGKVNDALALHESGDFSKSAVLADAMGRDDRIGGCASTRVNALAGKNGLAFSITPPEGGPKPLAKLVGEWWHDAVTDAAIKALAKDMVLLGLAIGRVHWVLSESEWKIARVERWHLSNVRWDEWKERFVTYAMSGEQIVIEPGDPGWLVITPAGEKSWMAGAVRGLGLPFVMRSFNWRDWAKYNERHGIPIIAIEEPSNTTPQTRDAFYQQLKNLGRTGVLRLPQTASSTQTGFGFKASFLEPKDRAFETFTKFRSDLDVGIAVFLLGQNLTTEVQGGSFAAASVHGRVRNDYLSADTEGLSTPLRDQVIKPWCMFNVRGFQPEQAPWPQWDTAIPEDLKSGADTLNVLGDAVTKLEAAGFPVDGDELATRYKLPLRKGEKYKPPEPEPMPEPGQPVGGDGDPAPEARRPTAMLRTRSGVPVAASSGFISGQLFCDDLADDAGDKAGAALESTLLTDLAAAIQGAKDYDDVRAAVKKAYANAASPEVVRDALQKALILADMAGAAAVRQDSV